MQIDQKTLSRLLAMNDAQLGAVIHKIASEAGIDPAQLGLNPESIGSIRKALGSATEADIAQMNAVYEAYKQGKKA